MRSGKHLGGRSCLSQSRRIGLTLVWIFVAISGWVGAAAAEIKQPNFITQHWSAG
jgi:hypothetical protein